jgi:hypothetical protein
MPFPEPGHLPSAVAEYAYVSEDHSIDITSKTNELGVRLGLPNRVSVRGASGVYLGLCALRSYSESDAVKVGRAACTEIVSLYKPASNGSHSVNCAYFEWNEDKAAKKLGPRHLDAITRACDIYMPKVKSRKQRCFTLLVLGLELPEDFILPESDGWIDKFNF